MKPARRKKQAGFVLSLETVLLLTILGIGLFVGIIAIRDVVFKLVLSKQDQSFYVFDSSPDPNDPNKVLSIAIGKVMTFDEHEAPIVPFIDYDPLGNGANFRALIGVRDDRFTSRQPLFYATNDCSDPIPCIAGPGNEAAYNLGIDERPTSGAVGYIYALQGVTYGIGAGAATTPATQLKGRLFRQGVDACGLNPTHMWDSQRVVTGNPCVPVPVAVQQNQLFDTVSVTDANGNNVLDVLLPPFYTNMVSTPSVTYTTIPPVSEGNSLP